jgi:bifunctional UDP-N-acetylglucosamine pyrophosphorylase / glucosamine-1-phosphate N-acetyltransferase
MTTIQTIILAAGKGTRMQSDIPKPLIEVNGKPMLSHVLTALAESNITTSPVIVVGAWTNAIQSYFGTEYSYVVQTEIDGTGGAVRVAMSQIDSDQSAPPVMILYADHPFITSQSISRLSALATTSRAVISMYTVTVPDFEGWRQPFASFGRIIRNENGEVLEIVEYKNADEQQRAIGEVNPALYCIQAKWLHEVVDTLVPNALTGEYYLTDIIKRATEQGHKIATIPLSPNEALGLNSFADIENAKQALLSE